MIELKNLSKKFMTSDGEVQALKDVNITVGDGDIYGIIGMSGAGRVRLYDVLICSNARPAARSL